MTGKRKIGKRKAETPKVATCPSKKKPSNFPFSLNQATSSPTQPSVQLSRSPQAKPKGAVPHREDTQEATSAVSPPKKNTSKEMQSASVPQSPQAKPKGAVPQREDEQEPTSVKENTGKKRQGAAYYGSRFKKEWTKQWSFIRAATDPHSFHCTICARDVSCKHQGKADVERHIGKDMHQNNLKRIEGQNKLTYVSNQDPLTEKVCFIFKFMIMTKTRSVMSFLGVFVVSVSPKFL